MPQATPSRRRSSLLLHALRIAGIVVFACAACSTTKAPPPQPAQPATAPEPPPPQPPTAEGRAQAQKLARDAADALQRGDEAGARSILERALQLDYTSELARSLMSQINADAQAELGSTYFSYTVQADDSLSKLAQQYLGDRFKFYILAKYNDIAVPARLARGQVIKVPGKAPVSRPAPKAADKPAEPPARHGEPARSAEPPVRSAAPAETAKPAVSEETPKPAAAEAPKDAPAKPDAAAGEPAARRLGPATQARVAQLNREAESAYRHQDLDTAIAKWGEVLRLDPNDTQAKLKRDKALVLKDKLGKVK